MIHLNYGHKYLYDYEFIKYLAIDIGFSSVEKVGNFSVPDETIVAYLKKRKPPAWDIETETYILFK